MTLARPPTDTGSPTYWTHQRVNVLSPPSTQSFMTHLASYSCTLSSAGLSKAGEKFPPSRGRRRASIKELTGGIVFIFTLQLRRKYSHFKTSKRCFIEMSKSK